MRRRTVQGQLGVAHSRATREAATGSPVIPMPPVSTGLRAALVFGFAFVSVLGQTLESTIYLPDSYGGIRCPTSLTLDVPGDRIFVAGTRADRILIIDCRTNQRVGYVPVHAGYMPILGYNPASHKIYSHAGDIGWYCIADADSGRVILEFSASGRFQEDVRRFFCDSAGNRVYCLTEDGTPVGVIDGRTDSVYVTQFAGQPAGISRYDTVTQRWVEYRCSTVVVDSGVGQAAGPPGSPARCFNPRTGRAYEVARGAREMVVTEDDSVVARILLNFGSSGCYSPRHDRLYCPDRDQLAVVDLAAKRVVSLLPVKGHLVAACYSAVHNRVYLADDSGGAVVVFDPDSNRVVTRIDVNGHPGSLLYDAALDRLWCADPDAGRLTTIDCRAGRVLADIGLGTGGWWPQHLCLDSPDRKLYCASMQESTLCVVDAERGNLISQLKLPGAAGGVCFNHQDHKLYCALHWKPARLAVIDTRTDALVRTIHLGDEEMDCPYELCYSPAANRVYCAGWGKTAIVDCERDSIVRTIGLGTLPRSVFFNPRTRRIYASDVATWGTHTLRVYDEAADSAWEVAGVESPKQILWDRGNRLFVSGPSRIFVLRDE